jgi:hypothetical protein
LLGTKENIPTDHGADQEGDQAWQVSLAGALDEGR